MHIAAALERIRDKGVWVWGWGGGGVGGQMSMKGESEILQHGEHPVARMCSAENIITEVTQLPHSMPIAHGIDGSSPLPPPPPVTPSPVITPPPPPPPRSPRDPKK